MADQTEWHLAKLTPKAPVGENEIEWQAPDGSTRCIAWVNHALYDDEGGFIEYQAVGRDVTDRRRAEEELKEALAEKEVLLREVHHRVKNNMAVISSLLNLQSDGVTDAVAIGVLQSMRDRIRTMALVHDQLYRSGDFANVDLAEYIRSVTDALYQSHSSRAEKVAIRTEVADVKMEIDDAIPCGLILSELISNAFKHAFPGGFLDVGAEYADKLAKAQADRAAGAMKAMEEAGAKVIYLSDAERKRWAAKLPNVPMNWAKSMEQKGMPGKAVLKGYLDGLRQRGTVLVRDWDK